MEYTMGSYQVAVIGAGHAGIEAALAAARLGAKTAIFTMSLDAIGNMPCNPSIGGTAKGHLVREIDALGGEMGKAADATFLQSRMLNRGKGPAVHSLRVQSDREAYHARDEAAGWKSRRAWTSSRRRSATSVWTRAARLKKLSPSSVRCMRCRRPSSAPAPSCTAAIYVGDVSYESGPDGLHAAVGLSDGAANGWAFICAALRPAPRPGCAGIASTIRQAGGAGGGREDHPLLL